MMATSYVMLLSRETGFVAKVAELKADSQYVIGCRWKSREVAAVLVASHGVVHKIVTTELNY